MVVIKLVVVLIILCILYPLAKFAIKVFTSDDGEIKNKMDEIKDVANTAEVVKDYTKQNKEIIDSFEQNKEVIEKFKS